MGTGILKTIGENLQFVLVCALVILAIVAVAKLIEDKVLKNSVAKMSKTRYITICAMLGALAMILHIFDFPVAFLAPGFYKLDFSEIPVMIGAFCLGPVGGVHLRGSGEAAGERVSDGLRRQRPEFPVGQSQAPGNAGRDPGPGTEIL